MYTAQHARTNTPDGYPELDTRISRAVAEAKRWGATMADLRVRIEDPWFHTIGEELKQRGFTFIDVPEMCLAGDVRFGW